MCVYYCSTVCVFITAGPIIKLCAGGEGDSEGHVLRETTSRGQCELVCPSRTNERGGEGYCVKGGGEEEGERERELLQSCSREGERDYKAVQLLLLRFPKRILFSLQ